MRIKAYAKINWSLDITGICENGYHLLDMVMQKIDLCDELIINKAPSLSLCIEGNTSLPADNDNLVLRAANLLRKKDQQGALIRLIKRIPTGAGLGGGSADAAAILLALNEMWELNYDLQTLSAMALSLGADVPYCLTDKPARVKGIGEVIEPFFAVKQFDIVIVKPEASLSTKDVYKAWNSEAHPLHPDMDAVQAAVAEYDIHSLASVPGNTLEGPACRMLPEICDCIDSLTQMNAICARMTGSGSAVFGIFHSDTEAQHAVQTLKNRFPVCMATKTK